MHNSIKSSTEAFNEDKESEQFEVEIEEGLRDDQMYSLVQIYQKRLQASKENPDILDTEGLPSNRNIKSKCTYIQRHNQDELNSLFVAKEASKFGNFRKIEIDENVEFTAKSQPFLQTTVGVGMIVGRPVAKAAKHGSSDPIVSDNGRNDYFSISISKRIDRPCIATSNDEIKPLYRTQVTEVL